MSGEALTTAFSQDLHDMKFHIETFFVPPTFGSEFDLDKFYGVRLAPLLRMR